jgi:hypothetical protein
VTFASLYIKHLGWLPIFGTKENKNNVHNLIFASCHIFLSFSVSWHFNTFASLYIKHLGWLPIFGGFCLYSSCVCLVYPMLSVSLNCLFLIDPSVFSNVYLLSTVCRVYPEIYLIDYTLKDLNVLVSKCCFCFISLTQYFCGRIKNKLIVYAQDAQYATDIPNSSH